LLQYFALKNSVLLPVLPHSRQVMMPMSGRGSTWFPLFLSYLHSLLQNRGE
jgi:hypothetical protein